jgi:hypothetical protein
VAALTCEGLTGREGSESGDEEREARTRDWGGHGGWRRGIEGGSEGRIGGGARRLAARNRGRERRMGRISFFLLNADARDRAGGTHGERQTRGANARTTGKTTYQVFLVSSFFLGIEICSPTQSEKSQIRHEVCFSVTISAFIYSI